jgi:hypothetical protein
MADTPNHEYNVPQQGTQDWHNPLNENFEAFEVDIELRGTESNLGNYTPTAGAKFLATDTGVVYTGNGTTWVPQFVFPEYDPSAGTATVAQTLVTAELDVDTIIGQLTGGTTLSTIAGDNLSIDSNGQLNASTGGGGGGGISSLSGGDGISPDSIGDGDTLSVAWGDASSLDGSGTVTNWSGAADLDSSGAVDTLSGSVTGGTTLTDLTGNNLSIDSNGRLNASTGGGGGGISNLSGGDGINPGSIGDGDTLSVAWGDGSDLDTAGAVDTISGSVTGGTTLSDLTGNNLSIDSNGRLNATTSGGGISGLSGGDGINPSSIGDGDTISVAWGDAGTLDSGGNVDDWSGAADLDASGSLTLNVIQSLTGGDGVTPGNIGDGDTLSVAWGDANDLDSDGNVTSQNWTTSNNRLAPSDSSITGIDVDQVETTTLTVDGTPTLQLSSTGTDSNNNTTGGNVVGGYEDNGVQNGAVGVSIGGGGSEGTAQVDGTERANTNEVTDNWGTIGGGRNNRADSFSTIAGGDKNTVIGTQGTIGGGIENTIGTAQKGTIGGGQNNTVSSGGGTVGGGRNNESSGAFSTVGGGDGNTASGGNATVGGGDSNDAGDSFATISGGTGNTINSPEGTIGGGRNNTVSTGGGTVGGGRNNEAGQLSTVGGGDDNTAGGTEATVGGGNNNTASSTYATIPGGTGNVASGTASFAAGSGAEAGHDGAFVWADSTGGFSSTGGDQFLVKASGGTGIGTNSPVTTFHVKDSVAESGGDNIGRHVAAIQNTSNSSNPVPDVLGLELTNVSNPTQFNSYISFMDQNGTIGNIQGDGNGGVEFTGSTADFAECFPKADPEQEFGDGTLVGLRDGEVVDLTDESDPDTVMVVSTAPLMTGNRPIDEDDRDDYVKLSLVGQVPVQVSDSVTAGDVLVASPNNDGTAVPRADCDASDRPIVGLALEDCVAGNQVRTLINGPGRNATEMDESTVSASVDSETKTERLDALEAENEKLKQEMANKDQQISDLEADIVAKDERIDDLEAENEELRDRVAAVEERLAALDSGGTAPASADD